MDTCETCKWWKRDHLGTFAHRSTQYKDTGVCLESESKTIAPKLDWQHSLPDWVNKGTMKLSIETSKDYGCINHITSDYIK